MVIICPNCGFENKDDFNFCYNCGNPLNINNQNKIAMDNKNLIVASYFFTILFSWGGLILSFFLNFSNFGFFSFFGIFIPFYLIQSKNSNLRKHGFIQIAISFLGILLFFLLIFNF